MTRLRSLFGRLIGGCRFDDLTDAPKGNEDAAEDRDQRDDESRFLHERALSGRPQTGNLSS